MLDLSVLILQGVGIALELGGNDVQLSSLLIDTNKLFENFVRVSLAKHAKQQRLAGRACSTATPRARSTSTTCPIRCRHRSACPWQRWRRVDPGKAQPDIVLRALDGTFPLVAEVKNTAHGKDAQADDVLPERGEVEQAVTYALRYDLRLHAADPPVDQGHQGLVYVGRVRSVDVYDYRLDLSSDEGIDAALADMATTVAGLAGLIGSAAECPGDPSSSRGRRRWRRGPPRWPS